MKKKKILKLKKSSKDKRRYFLTDSVSSESVKKSLLEYLGILGCSKASYVEVKEKEISKENIIGSCLRESLHDVRTALTLSKINILKVSSTIKGLKV